MFPDCLSPAVFNSRDAILVSSQRELLVAQDIWRYNLAVTLKYHGPNRPIQSTRKHSRNSLRKFKYTKSPTDSFQPRRHHIGVSVVDREYLTKDSALKGKVLLHATGLEYTRIEELHKNR
jgi:hypothetical protein